MEPCEVLNPFGELLNGDAKAIDNLSVVGEVWAHQRDGIAIDKDTVTPRPSTTCRYYY